MKLSGLTAIITGASQGLGVAIARRFVGDGANVILAARSQDLLEKVRQSLLPLRGPAQIVEGVRCDVAQASEVDQLIDAAVAATSRLDILVTNASIFGPMGPLVEVPWSEWVETLNVNLLGTVVRKCVV